MEHRTNLLIALGEWWEERQARRSAQSDHADTLPRRAWLPTPGNTVFTVAFTLLVIAGLLWVQSVGAITLGAPLAAGSSTGTIAYQGRLADTGGAPLTGTYNMIFRLYAVASGSTPLWEEQWTGANSVQVSDGLFNVMLGSLAAVPQNIAAANSNLFLGVTVGTDSEMTPRVQLGSVPFAVQALTVPDGSVTRSKLAAGILPIAFSTGDVYYTPITAMTGWANKHVFSDVRQTITVSQRSRVIVSATADLVVSEGAGWLYAAIARGNEWSTLDRHAPGAATWTKYAWSGMDTVEPGTYSYTLSAMGSSGLKIQWYHPNITLVVIPFEE